MQPVSQTYSQRTGESAHERELDWMSPHWAQTIQCFLQASLASSTKQTYRTGKEKYLGFYQQAGLTPLPEN